ncbi:Protein CBG06177 [Caenorhabditis briggsae]|uniref:Protein CBG06177 n=1 Tax=Caenorhabditis briggsae TaxID=6238 RepID=A8X0R2_CAEBR|nr:Protein CBG06177 [Caenorhabditis briggsae]CAP26222.1 Protein CBG06177 [Caenorhabditis briggsae]
MNKIVNKSMIGVAKRIMMCRPTHFKVNYSINPWMDEKVQADFEKATKQWNTLKSTIEKCGAEVVVMESEDARDYPDIVFCANAGILRGKKIYLSHFAFPERYGEHVFYKRFFDELGFETSFNRKIIHEGAGDALWCGEGMNILVSGVGPRSDVQACEDIQQKIKLNADDKFYVVAARLVDPRFYHVDTCFCPLDENLAMAYMPAFDSVSQNNIRNYTELLPVPEKDARRFVCNSVVIGKHVIVHHGSDITFKLLEKHGYQVHPIDMSEFMKAGGSAKCCTLRLE